MINFSKYHTKYLLEALNQFRILKSSSYVLEELENTGEYVGPHFILAKNDDVLLYLDYRNDPVSEQELREELSKREHIPNKKEARILRKEKAKQQRNR